MGYQICIWYLTIRTPIQLSIYFITLAAFTKYGNVILIIDHVHRLELVGSTSFLCHHHVNILI